MSIPRITFGVIVLNGEPFTRYVLRMLYPFAHQIVVVEGASPAAAGIAAADGHSMDGTLDVLRRFQSEEDAERKVAVVMAEDEGHPNGFWPGEKDEQSRAYARRASGDWLWQVDTDEFYMPQDLTWICTELLNQPAVQAVSFPQLQFWGGLEYRVDGWYLRRGNEVYHRLFRWQPGFTYASHRPPTVLDERGIDLRQRGWVDSRALARRGIFLYHYSLVFPHQVRAKADYYSRVDWHRFERMNEWRQNAFERLNWPYRVHNVYYQPSWLERYHGPHPPLVLQMFADLRQGRVGDGIALRPADDVERLLASPAYRLGRIVLKVAGAAIIRGTRLAQKILRMLPPPAQRALKRALGMRWAAP